jgi:zona occludens toxin (predicted ATPase)
MAIRAICGLTGSGKSYKAMQIALSAYQSGTPIVTNIPHNIDSPDVYLWDWRYIRPDADELPFPNGAVYLLDEAWRMEISKIKARQNERLLSFFKEHRHRTSVSGVSDEIYIVTQSLGDIAPVVVELVEETIICVKPTNLAMKSKSFRYYHAGAVKGVEKVQAKLVKTELETLSNDIFQLYQTDTLGSGAGGYDKEGLTGGSTIFQGAKFKFYLAVFIICILAIIYCFYSLKHSKTLSNSIPTTISTVAPTPSQIQQAQPQAQPFILPVQLPPPQSKPPKPEYSERWRVAGRIKGIVDEVEQHILYLVDRKGHIKRVLESACIHDNFQQYTCFIDGEKIDAYSGSYNSVADTLVSSISTH